MPFQAFVKLKAVGNSNSFQFIPFHITYLLNLTLQRYYKFSYCSNPYYEKTYYQVRFNIWAQKAPDAVHVKIHGAIGVVSYHYMKAVVF